MKKTLTINSVVNGEGDSPAINREGQFLYSFGIDPEIQENYGVGKAALGIIPTRAVVKSGAELTATPVWIMETPKNDLIYIYSSDGVFISYNTSFTATALTTPTAGAGNGAAYYNNYIYLATPTDIARYGPLNNSPSLTQTVWTGATLGAQTALNDTTYPSNGSILFPNHPMHLHVDNKLYVGDYGGTAAGATLAGKGLIHFIKTTKTTDEGDTNDGSTYAALDLPFNYFPVDIESWGTDLIILAMQGASININQGKAAIFIWDTVSDSFYRQIDLPDATATALKNINGEIYIYGGASSYRTTTYKYIGGYGVTAIDHKITGGQDTTCHPPLAGAVDAITTRRLFAVGKGVRALGYTTPTLPQGAANNILVDSGSNIINSLKYYRQSADTQLAVLIGSTTGLQQLTTADSSAAVFFNSYWYSNVFNIGQPGSVEKVTVPLYDQVGAKDTLEVKVVVDGSGSSTTLTTINNTNFSGLDYIEFTTPTGGIPFKSDFFLLFQWSGQTKTAVKLPIIIDIDIKPR